MKSMVGVLVGITVVVGVSVSVVVLAAARWERSGVSAEGARGQYNGAESRLLLSGTQTKITKALIRLLFWVAVSMVIIWLLKE